MCAKSELTVADVAAECETVIDQIDPEFTYNRADLYGWVANCWPCDSSPADIACDFVNGIKATEFESAIEGALGEFAISDHNPCGGTGYLEPAEALPYRILFCDGAECERFATAAEAIEAAEAYAKEMRRQA